MFNDKSFTRIVYLGACLITVFAFTFGYIYTTGKIKNKEIASDIGSYEGTNINSALNENQSVEEVSSQSQMYEDTKLTRRTKYTVCSHTLTDSSKVTPDIAKLTEKQFKIAYKEWNVDKFSKDEIIISRTLNEKCPEHYTVKEKDGKIAVYYQKPINGISLKEITNIPVSSLPNSDQIKLRQGIKIESNQELAELLEDFGS